MSVQKMTYCRVYDLLDAPVFQKYNARIVPKVNKGSLGGIQGKTHIQNNAFKLRWQKKSFIFSSNFIKKD